MEKLSTPSSSLNATPSPSQKVRRIPSPSTTTKQGPIKAVKQFLYFPQNSPTKNNGRKKESPVSSPTSSDSGHRIWTGWSPTDHWERKSPNSPIIKVERPKSVRLSPASSSRAPSIEIQAYLHGQWPRDTCIYHTHSTGANPHSFVQDQSTQTSEDWDVTTNSSGEKRTKKGHRRSASLGQHEQLQLIRHRLQKTKEGSKQTESSKPRQSPVPANHSALPTAQSTFTQPKSIPHNIPKPSMPRYQRNSVEGLNTEIEKLVLKSISLTEDEDKVHTHDIPDGHRAPLPEQQHQHHQQLRGGNVVIGVNSTSSTSNTTSTRSLYTQTPSESVEITSSASSSNESHSCSSNNSSAAGSRSQSVSPVMPIIPAGHMETSRPSSQTDSTNNVSTKETEKGEPDLPVIASPEPKFVSSPKPNMSYSFAREPPDGCERIRATCVESAKKTPSIKEPLLFCSPKNNAYVLKPSVTSAFNPLYKSLISQTPELALRSPAAAVVASTGQTQASIEGQ